MSPMKQEVIHIKTVRLKSFSHRVINNWNNMASEIVCAESVTIFKTRLDNLSH